MSGRIRAYVRQHHLALLCLFLILTGGTAYALDGSNTVFTDDIVDKQVKTADLDTEAVTSGRLGSDSVNTNKIAPGGVRTADLGDAAVSQAKLGPNAVNSAKVADNTLTGADVNESTLNIPGGGGGIVPAVRATSPDNPEFFSGDCLHFGATIPNNGNDASTLVPFASEDYDIGGTDADGLHTADPDCDPITARLTAPINGIYLMTATARWQGEDNNCSGCEYGFRDIAIRKDGATILARDTEPATVVAGGTFIENNPTSQTVTTVARLSANSYVEMLAKHGHANSLLQILDPNGTNFTMTWLGPAP